jgi:hypothetical protein
MHIGHDPVVVADAGDPDILGGADVEGAELANGVAVTDLQAGRLAAYFLSCGTSPSELNWKMRLSQPMRVRPEITTCGPITVLSPISTSSPMIE